MQPVLLAHYCLLLFKSFTTNLGWLDLDYWFSVLLIIILLSMTFMLTPQAQGSKQRQVLSYFVTK